MLKLNNIVKNYETGSTVVKALKGINLAFRKSEFVSVLGQSGCGKTTLLNIIGGLDKYTDGDLLIDGRSTKSYNDHDWDNYRNHKIGFVFQSYNLISHQTVLANVELALTLSGVPRAERRERAVEALRKVGLSDQLEKLPSEMSGGQMQRVAIARALVNDPEILLADEPTGALDSETSVQVMEILKEISKTKLVIMVTHNPELAEKYSTRIIRLLDGNVVSDTDPFDGGEKAEEIDGKQKKNCSMSFLTALSLSLNNLLTKKVRTFLISFAGSIGIIGIALILSVSSGVQAYINSVQEDTLSSYPLTIEAESVDATDLMKNIMKSEEKKVKHKKDKVYSGSAMYDMLNAMSAAQKNNNNLSKFKTYIEDHRDDFGDNLSAVSYSYDLDFNIYTKDSDGKIIKSDVNKLMSDLYGFSDDTLAAQSSNTFLNGFAGMKVWEEMLAGDNGKLYNDLLEEQYDVIYGSWPKDAHDIMLVVDENNEISDLCLYALGLESSENMKKIMESYKKGEKTEFKQRSWTYKEICDMKFKLVQASDYYKYDETKKEYRDLSKTDDGLDYLYNGGTELRVCGILRPNKDKTSAMLNGSIVYTSKLTQEVIKAANKNSTVKKQLENKDVDVFTGLRFKTGNEKELSKAQKAKDFKKYAENLSVSEKAELFSKISALPLESYVNSQVESVLKNLDRNGIEQLVLKNSDNSDMDADTLKKYMASMSDDELRKYVSEALADNVKKQYAERAEQQLSSYTASQLAAMLESEIGTYKTEQLSVYYDNFMPAVYSDSTYEENLKKLGYVELSNPSKINLYASTFAAKDEVANVIEKYNDKADKNSKINYTDYVALLMSSVTIIINAISYVLIAFVAISLVVSSIMIGIITYISVLERTKEIGILRAIGASKKDVSRVFNAETLTIGFVSGALGIAVSLLFIVVINIILHSLTGIASLNAVLPPIAAIVLVAVSMFLTFIAGLLPAGMAAKKDPVIALRSE